MISLDFLVGMPIDESGRYRLMSDNVQRILTEKACEAVKA